MPYNVFISYNSKDAETARKMQSYFARIQGVSPFLSETSLIIGPLAEALIQKIKGCDLFIVLYSKNSLSSNYVQQEIGAAKGNQKMIVPILLDSDAKPDAMLQGYNYLSLFDEAKRNEQMPRLFNYVVRKSKEKASNDAILALGALMILGYALSNDQEDQ